MRFSAIAFCDYLVFKEVTDQNLEPQ